MSHYIFSASPPNECEHNTYVTWDDGFTEEELNKIEQYCQNNLTIDAATIGKGAKDSDIRISSTAWVQLNDETAWFYDRMAWITRKLNSLFYRFDLTGFHEDFQYTIYDGKDSGHYGWHIDSSAFDDAPRKFSLVLQLSGPEDYEGGDLEIQTGTVPEVVQKKRGFITAFPSFRLHRVTPVTKGVRKTIVVWVVGPAFK